MGIFDWFRRTNKRCESLPDCIWMTQQAKLSGIVCEIQQRLMEDGLVIVIGHFAATLDEVAVSLDVAYHRVKYDWTYGDVQNLIRQHEPCAYLTLSNMVS